MKHPPIVVLLFCASVLTLGACEKKATGQVVAVVDGEEISLLDLSTEVQAGGEAPTNEQEKKAAVAAALRRLVDRQLLVQQAKSRGLDKDPDYLRQRRRMDDDLLIGLLGKQVGGNIGVPTQAEIASFVASNPQMFSGRTIYELQQIQFALPQQRERLKLLEKDKTLDAVTATLKGLGIEYTRSPAAMDSATAPKGFLSRILSLPPAEPFIVTSGGRVFVSVITGTTTKPIAPEQTQALAANALRQKKLSDLAEKQLADARRTAKITMQPGYSLPPPASPGGTTKP